MKQNINVGLTESHGMALEISKFPPDGVAYQFLKPTTDGHKFLKSPIKGYFRDFDSTGQDMIEAILSPVATDKTWIYSIANFQEALAFNFMGLPIPRKLRIHYMISLFMKPNFKKLIFWSQAGKASLNDYGEIKNKAFLEKVMVVYPAIREVPGHLIRFNSNSANMLFSGDFFRKGGASVVDAFQKAADHYPGMKLRICCDEKIDFNTGDKALRSEYLEKIHSDSRISFGRVDRDELIHTILPDTDIFISPTYYEAFGFAILEAMAFGIPVISTNHFAIPEMIHHGKSGFLVDIERFQTEELFKGYTVNQLPVELREYTTDHVYRHMCRLIESHTLRKTMGTQGLETARTKFSFATRNRLMSEVYAAAGQ